MYRTVRDSTLAGSTFNAMPRPRRSLVLSVVQLFVLLLPLAYIGAITFGFVGVLTGVALANASAGVVALVWLRAATSSTNRSAF
jgi:Na+-driven multidrug efflux pump